MTVRLDRSGDDEVASRTCGRQRRVADLVVERAGDREGMIVCVPAAVPATRLSWRVIPLPAPVVVNVRSPDPASIVPVPCGATTRECASVKSNPPEPLLVKPYSEAIWFVPVNVAPPTEDPVRAPAVIAPALSSILPDETKLRTQLVLVLIVPVIVRSLPAPVVVRLTLAATLLLSRTPETVSACPSVSVKSPVPVFVKLPSVETMFAPSKVA